MSWLELQIPLLEQMGGIRSRDPRLGLLSRSIRRSELAIRQWEVDRTTIAYSTNRFLLAPFPASIARAMLVLSEMVGSPLSDPMFHSGNAP